MKTSPAFLGALFQSVMDSAERRAQGAHYTTEKNILKVIEPPFLDDLRVRAEFNRLRARKDSRRHAESGAANPVLIPCRAAVDLLRRPGVRPLL